jgi:hypothetical protein
MCTFLSICYRQGNLKIKYNKKKKKSVTAPTKKVPVSVFKATKQLKNLGRWYL